MLSYLAFVFIPSLFVSVWLVALAWVMAKKAVAPMTSIIGTAAYAALAAGTIWSAYVAMVRIAAAS